MSPVRKPRTLFWTLLSAATLLAGAILAWWIIFPPVDHIPVQIYYELAAEGDDVPFCPSKSGTNVIGLPYVLPEELAYPQDLIVSINDGDDLVKNVHRWDNTLGLFVVYGPGDPSVSSFKVGEAVGVQMKEGVDYWIGHSPSPAAHVSLEAGDNLITIPSGAPIADAAELIIDIGEDNVEYVKRFSECTDGWEAYDPDDQGTNFSLVDGEGYFVKMTSSVDWYPPPSEYGGAATRVEHVLDAEGDDVPSCRSKSGLNTLALPYIRKDGLNTAQDLIDDIVEAGGLEAGGTGVQVFDYHPDQPELWTSGDFPLKPGKAVSVLTETNVTYPITGKDNPGASLLLESGLNFIALPYKSSANDAQALIEQIGGAEVEYVERFNECTDKWDRWYGEDSGIDGNNFDIHAGEGYVVKMSSTVNWVPETR